MNYNREPTADEVFLVTHTRRLKKKKNMHGENCENGEDNENDEDDEDFSGERI